MTLAKQTPEQYTVHLPSLEQRKQSLLDDMRSFLLDKYCTINGESVPCQVVDTDPADNRTYVKTHADSMTFCIPCDDVLAAEPVQVSEVV